MRVARRFNGVMGDLQNGQESVMDMMKRLDHDREVIHQQIRTKHATLQIIETRRCERA